MLLALRSLWEPQALVAPPAVLFVGAVNANGAATTIASASIDSTGYDHIVVAGIEGSVNTSITASDNKGSAFAVATSRADTVNGLYGSLSWARIGTPGAGHIVTVTFGASASFRRLGVWLVNSNAGSLVLQSATSAGGTGTASDAGTLTTAAASVSVLAACCNNTVTWAPTAGWTESAETGTDTVFDHRADATGGTINPAVTSSVSADWLAMAASFQSLAAITGTAAATLGPITQVAAGTVAVAGSSAATLGPVTQVATGTVEAAGITGTSNVTLGPVLSSAAGVVGIAGAQASTLGPVTSVATGTVSVRGAAAATLGPVTGAAAGAVGIAGAGAGTLGAITGSATGAVSIAGSSAVTLADVVGTATGTVMGVYVPSPLRLTSPSRTLSMDSPSRTASFASPARGMAVLSPARGAVFSSPARLAA